LTSFSINSDNEKCSDLENIYLPRMQYGVLSQMLARLPQTETIQHKINNYRLMNEIVINKHDDIVVNDCAGEIAKNFANQYIIPVDMKLYINGKKRVNVNECVILKAIYTCDYKDLINNEGLIQSVINKYCIPKDYIDKIPTEYGLFTQKQFVKSIDCNRMFENNAGKPSDDECVVIMAIYTKSYESLKGREHLVNYVIKKYGITKDIVDCIPKTFQINANMSEDMTLDVNLNRPSVDESIVLMAIYTKDYQHLKGREHCIEDVIKKYNISKDLVNSIPKPSLVKANVPQKNIVVNRQLDEIDLKAAILEKNWQVILSNQKAILDIIKNGSIYGVEVESVRQALVPPVKVNKTSPSSRRNSVIFDNHIDVVYDIESQSETEVSVNKDLSVPSPSLPIFVETQINSMSSMSKKNNCEDNTGMPLVKQKKGRK